jgi:hypothetical protein
LPSCDLVVVDVAAGGDDEPAVVFDPLFVFEPLPVFEPSVLDPFVTPFVSVLGAGFGDEVMEPPSGLMATRVVEEVVGCDEGESLLLEAELSLLNNDAVGNSEEPEGKDDVDSRDRISPLGKDVESRSGELEEDDAGGGCKGAVELTARDDRVGIEPRGGGLALGDSVGGTKGGLGNASDVEGVLGAGETGEEPEPILLMGVTGGFVEAPSIIDEVRSF